MFLPKRTWLRWMVFTILLPNAAECSELGFTARGESMAPTINVGDHIIADMGVIRPKARGAVVLVELPLEQQRRPYRIVGLPGDRIQMKRGIPFINGQAATQISRGRVRYISTNGAGDAELIEEHLPGEDGTHQILNIGQYETDDTKPVTLRSDRYFVLGDNRDHSADSRVPLASHGTGIITASQIVGRVIDESR
jgi:signal peptidase I